MSRTLIKIEVRQERDVVLTRQRARQLAQILGFTVREQTRIATAVSEIARNVQMYAGGGRAEFGVNDGDTPNLEIRICDQGPGIPHLQTVLDGRYRSPTGMGLGIVGAKRLMDEFDIRTESSGTVVEMKKYLPKSARRLPAPAAVAEELAKRGSQQPFDEVQQQNQELLQVLDELRIRQAEVERLNAELEETNRGVLALYAELDDKAEDLKRASDLKSKFLSNMTHELRTPLNSIIMITRLLLDGTEGELAAGQVKPVTLVQKSAEGLLELVNDLLDLAKIEAGKVDVRVSTFTADDVIGALRGIFRPLLPLHTCELVFEMPPEGCPELTTDEGKVSQILRNFISNAMKFTPKGEVRVSVTRVGEDRVRFAVADTGIGISTQDQARIFHEFGQLEAGKKLRGTGLGLSLSRRLAELLGGTVDLTSEVGVGSTFSVTIPCKYPGVQNTAGDHGGASALTNAGHV